MSKNSFCERSDLFRSLQSIRIKEPSERRPRSKRVRSSAEPQEPRSEEHTSELQSLAYLVCRLLLEKKKQTRLRRKANFPAPTTSLTRMTATWWSSTTLDSM